MYINQPKHNCWCERHFIISSLKIEISKCT